MCSGQLNNSSQYCTVPEMIEDFQRCIRTFKQMHWFENSREGKILKRHVAPGSTIANGPFK